LFCQRGSSTEMGKPGSEGLQVGDDTCSAARLNSCPARDRAHGVIAGTCTHVDCLEPLEARLPLPRPRYGVLRPSLNHGQGLRDEGMPDSRRVEKTDEKVPVLVFAEVAIPRGNHEGLPPTHQAAGLHEMVAVEGAWSRQQIVRRAAGPV